MIPHRQRFREIDDLFRRVLGHPTGDRSRFLEAATDDSELRAAVQRLLTADREARSFIDEPVVGGRVADPPSRFGAYRLLEPIGRGGMGEVYLAERADEAFDRRVAIKVLRADLLGPEPLERMRIERRTLARLEHPSIARLYDGGTTPDGRPYLVIEHVEGLPIDRYCRRHRLSLEARLRIFRRVCDAVAFSHRHLLVHRDLKPSNILVTAGGVPKLLDFGIAKPLMGDGSAAATLTRTGWRPMTPSYASPEQMRGDPVTTATDVYALGVVLCLLLTGRLPYRLEGATAARLERAICDEMPEPPSVLAAAGAPEDEPPCPPRALRGDLDNIVLTALRKEPERRYANAEQLAEDVRRVLDHRPVSARRDSWRYQLSKLVRRHRLAVATVALAIAALLSSLVLVSLQVGRANRERQKAEVALTFLSGLFKLADPFQRDGEPPTVLDVLAAGAARIESELAGQPEIQAELVATIAEAYTDQGRAAEALGLLDRAIARHREELGPGHPGEAALLVRRGWASFAAGELRAAEVAFRRGLGVRVQALGDEHPALWEAISGLGTTLVQKGDYEGGRAHLERALELYRRLEDEDPLELAELLGQLALPYYSLARYDEAAALYRRALALRRGVLGAGHFSVASDTVSLATSLTEQEPREAERLYRRAITTLEAVLDGDPHPLLAVAVSNLGHLLYQRGRRDEGEGLFRRALDIRRHLPGDDRVSLAGDLTKLGIALSDRERYGESRELFREALQIYLERLGADHYQHGRVLYLMARDDKALGDLATAEANLRRALEILRRSLGPRHPNTAYPLQALGRLHFERGERVAALETFTRAGDILRGSLPAGHWRIAVADASRGETLLSLGRWAEAEPLITRSAALLAAALPSEDRRVAEAEALLDALAVAQAEAR